MIGKNFNKNRIGKKKKKSPVLMIVHVFIFFHNSAHEITNKITKHVLCFQSKQMFF